MGSIVFPVPCPPTFVVHALPQTFSSRLFHGMGTLSPSISCLTADYRETYTSTSQLPEHWFVLLLVNPKSELPVFPGLPSNMLPTLP